MPTTITAYIVAFLQILNLIIYLMFPLAFLFFLVNVVRYFIIGGGNEDAQEKARSLAVWGLLGLVVLFAIWGIVNIVVMTFNLQGSGTPIIPDYVQTTMTTQGGNNTTQNSNGNSGLDFGDLNWQ